jgi:hypothetical protein
LGDLWDEVIEFSTFGPGERKLLKARREQEKPQQQEDDITTESFQHAKRNLVAYRYKPPSQTAVSANNDDDGSRMISLEAFQAVVTASKDLQEDVEMPDLDGYALRDLLVARWGVPLDVDFQRGTNMQHRSVYCTIFPVAFGSSKCRHLAELDYLMHLQGVVEVLRKYQNLERFVVLLETTTKEPKPGTDSVPFRLELNNSQLEQILG